MKEYYEFCEYVRDNMQLYLSREIEDIKLNLKEVSKVNSISRIGISAEAESRKAVPVIYMEEPYEDYRNGRDIDDICESAGKMYRSLLDREFEVDIDLSDYEKIKDRIIPTAVNYKANRNLLCDVPYRKVDDLAIIYKIDFGNFDDGKAVTNVKNEMIDGWNISEDELYSSAFSNMEKKEPPLFIEMKDMLKMMLKEQHADYPEMEFEDNSSIDEPSMYVLSNKSRDNGSAYIADEKIMDSIAEKLDDSFYVIPSSIHELIVIPEKDFKDNGFSSREAGKIIREINSTVVKREDYLSDHLYRYSKDERTIESVKDSMNRSADRER